MTNAWSRRDVLRAGGTLTAAAGTGMLAGAVPAMATGSGGSGGSDTFRHGIASGDPLPEGVLLWTRVTPTADARPGSGAGPAVRLRWEVARDPGFTALAAAGDATTGADRDHTVKVDVTGLQPGTWYWYRFRLGSEVSPVGRTRTAPAAGGAVDRLRFGVVSCSDYQAGHFAAYGHLAARDDLDLVVHLGDYLYEYGAGGGVRAHDPAVETTTLEHYRRRHAQYKADPHLQALHASVPFAVTWDDHESANNAWAGGAENHTSPEEGTWEARRAFAQRAYAEWMPVRYEPGGKLYRRLTFGGLAELSMLDLRTYRSRQAAYPFDPAITDPDATIAGKEQLEWLTAGLVTAGAQWKLVGNPVMIAPLRIPATLSTRNLLAMTELLGPLDGGLALNTDQWDGYTADRWAVFDALREHGVTDTVFLTGDIHTAWAAELPADPLTYPLNRNSVATEFVVSSVTSDNIDDILGVAPRTTSPVLESAVRLTNPHLKHVELDSHGFSVLEVTPAAVQMDWYTLADRTDPASTAGVDVSYVVRAGTQHVTRAGEALR